MHTPYLYSKMDVLGGFLIALVLSWLLTPTAGRIAIRLGIVDSPSQIKAHHHPTPLLGGVSIFISYLFAILFTLGISREILAILTGGAILLAIGIIDDKAGMMPKIKLFGQIIAALIVTKMGIRVAFIENYYLSLLFSIVWIVGITNAINLLDNLNGLSGGITAISALAFCVLSLERGDFMVATVAITLFGATSGFLKYNFPKAHIFMGDAGSLFTGFLLAVIAILGSWSSPTQITSLAIPILILGYPIFDTTLVTLSRIHGRRSIFQGGKDHSSHRLALLGLKKTRAVFVIYFITACLSLSGYIISKVNRPIEAILIASVVLFCMILLGLRLALVSVGSKGRRKG